MPPAHVVTTVPAAVASLLDPAERHLRDERLRGWDPYDALCSPVFRLPMLRSSHLLRWGAQQVLKRLGVNLRPLLRIEKQLNPVTVGLYLQGLAHRAEAEDDANSRRGEAGRCVALLADLISDGYSGACWGYPFDWEARYATIPAATPTIVATGMVTNSLVIADRAFDLPAAREMVLSACSFVRSDLRRTPGPAGSFCWAYSPLDRQVVLNATLKGSRLLAQARALGGADDLLGEARRSALFVQAHQAPSGAWPYAIGDARRWADNFHTGYVLECLDEYRRCSGDADVDETVTRGWSYYRERFFAEDLTPKYYDHGLYPIDATACAQAIITLCAFGDIPAAAGAAERAIATLAKPDGSFAYQRTRRRTVRIPYLRWSTAWMYCALARLAAAVRAPP